MRAMQCKGFQMNAVIWNMWYGGRVSVYPSPLKKNRKKEVLLKYLRYILYIYIYREREIESIKNPCEADRSIQWRRFPRRVHHWKRHSNH